MGVKIYLQNGYIITLRGTDYKPGYFVDFGMEKLDIRRRIYDSARINSR